jgi:hypothetical protein
MIRIFPILIAFFLLVSCSNKGLDVVEAIPVIKYSEISAGKYAFTVDGQNIINYNWNFGDNGALSSQSNPIYTFRFNGEYTVTVIVQIQSGNSQKTHTIKEKVNVNSLKTATPKFQLVIEVDNRTITVINPSIYLKKIEWEFIDKYEGTRKVNVNNAKHLFPWNVEHQVRMTATVEAKNGDTTYTDTQNVKITGNPVPQIVPRVIQSPFFITDETSLSFDFDEFYQYIEIESGDDTFGKKSFGNGSMSKTNIKYSYFYPHKGPFPLRIKVTNPNGTNTFSIPITGNGYSTFQQSVYLLILKESGNDFGYVDIDTPPNQTGAVRIDCRLESKVQNFTIVPFSPNNNEIYKKTKVELSKLTGSRFELGGGGIPSSFTVLGSYTPQSGGYYTIKMTPVNHRFIYIRDPKNTGRFICTESLNFSSNIIRFISTSDLKTINNYYSSEGDYNSSNSYLQFFDYFYTRYIPNRTDKNGWYLYSDFPLYEKTKGGN